MARRTALDRDLTVIHERLRYLGEKCARLVDQAVSAVLTRSDWLAVRSLADAKSVRDLRRDVERACVITIATQQPSARDLRFLVATPHIAVELERIAEHAHGIARISQRLIDLPNELPVLDIEHMHRLASAMLKRALLAMDRQDAAMATYAASLDEAVDGVQAQYRRVLLTYFMANGGSGSVETGTYLLWIAHNLERIADHVTNICERVAFAVTGEIVETSR